MKEIFLMIEIEAPQHTNEMKKKNIFFRWKSQMEFGIEITSAMGIFILDVDNITFSPTNPKGCLLQLNNDTCNQQNTT